MVEQRWTRLIDKEPPMGVAVDTKIDDAKGVRNEQQLKRNGALWFFPDGSMYVYYTPTHWRFTESTSKKL
jgi:hypothetical protein